MIPKATTNSDTHTSQSRPVLPKKKKRAVVEYAERDTKAEKKTVALMVNIVFFPEDVCDRTSKETAKIDTHTYTHHHQCASGPRDAHPKKLCCYCPCAFQQRGAQIFGSPHSFTRILRVTAISQWQRRILLLS